MNKVMSFSVLAVSICLSIATANAQTCAPLPNNLTNGTTADAAQVMANFNALLACINAQAAPRSYLAGLTMANDASNTVIDTAPGVATSDDQATLMSLPSAFQKNVSAAWSSGPGTSIGCLDSGNLQPSQWYHLFVIARVDSTPAVDELCSTNATAPTMPPNYTKKRRIGSFKTDGSSHILAFTQIGDEFTLKTAVADISGASVGTASRTTLTFSSVPPGVSVVAVFTASMGGAAAAFDLLWFTTMDQADNAQIPGQLDIIAPSAGTAAGGRFLIHTNTSQQLGVRAQGNPNSIYVLTNGWYDTRGRLN